MSTNQSKEAAATPQFNVSRKRSADIVDATVKLSETMKGHPDFTTTPGLSDVVTSWVAAAQAIDQHSQEAQTSRAQMKAAVAARAKAKLAWKRATKTVLARVGELTLGSPAAVKAWGFDVATRTRRATSSEAPGGLAARYTKEFELYFVWNRVNGNVGYTLQMGDGSPQGWGAPILCPKAKYVPTGLVPGQHISFRVAVQRTSGLSAWSDALAVVVR